MPGRRKGGREKRLPLTTETLKRFEITYTGRELINGRPALMLDLKPAKKRPPENSIKDRIISRAAGRIWLDESDSALVKADLHLTQGLNIVGGLVGAVWKFNCCLERERTPDGLWYTGKLDWHLEGREVLVQRIVDCHEEKTAVRKTEASIGHVDATDKDD